jgi:hypothetical protein
MPSYLKLKKPPDAILLAFGVFALLLIILSTAWGFRHGIPPTRAQVENELAQIAPPPGAVITQQFPFTSGHMEMLVTITKRTSPMIRFARTTTLNSRVMAGRFGNRFS